MKKINYFFILTCFPSLLFSQEIILPVGGNPEAKKYYKNAVAEKKSVSADPVELPFIDDFSDSEVEPDPGRWTDNNAYINNKFSRDQVTNGIATLDAYTSKGSHYPNAGSNPYKADYLTTQPINLDYSPADNIFLSFFYQAKGLGEMPDQADSLCLEFYEPENERWNLVWHATGDTIMENFSWVIIPVNEEKYLHNGFKFRFFNYASQSANNDFNDKFSNVDHWHIDYIILDRDRNPTDSLLRDVTFTKPIRSILKHYESIPWTHLQNAYFTQRKPTIEVEISNMDTAIRNVTKTLRITDVFNDFTYSPTPTANDILPGEVFDFNFAYDYPFDFNSGDSALFRIQTILRTDAFDYKPNDTLEYYQVMNNYYAYDDGSAEAGYGLRGQGTKNASAAVRFNSFNEDSLRAVDVYFNQVIDSLNLDYFFYLKVWDDNNGEPGNVRYSQIGMKPAYSNDLNKPVRYMLDSVISVQGNFYVGWTKTVDKMLNIGLDLNRNNSTNNKYNIGSGWLESIIPGSFMIRPVLSKTPIITKLRKTESETKSLNIYPNPANTWITLDIKPEISGQIMVQIFDMKGRMVLQDSSFRGSRIQVNHLENGIYFVNVMNPNGGNKITKKIIVQH